MCGEKDSYTEKELYAILNILRNKLTQLKHENRNLVPEYIDGEEYFIRRIALLNNMYAVETAIIYMEALMSGHNLDNNNHGIYPEISELVCIDASDEIKRLQQIFGNILHLKKNVPASYIPSLLLACNKRISQLRAHEKQ
jgi:hypothetical protein